MDDFKMTSTDDEKATNDMIKEMVDRTKTAEEKKKERRTDNTKWEVFSSIPAHKVLPLVLEGKVKHLPNTFERDPFIMKDTQIEFVYMVDFEERTVETAARIDDDKPVPIGKVKIGEVGDAVKFVNDLMGRLGGSSIPSSMLDGTNGLTTERDMMDHLC